MAATAPDYGILFNNRFPPASYNISQKNIPNPLANWKLGNMAALASGFGFPNDGQPVKSASALARDTSFHDCPEGSGWAENSVEGWDEDWVIHLAGGRNHGKKKR